MSGLFAFFSLTKIYTLQLRWSYVLLHDVIEPLAMAALMFWHIILFVKKIVVSSIGISRISDYETFLSYQAKVSTYSVCLLLLVQKNSLFRNPVFSLAELRAGKKQGFGIDALAVTQLQSWSPTNPSTPGDWQHENLSPLFGNHQTFYSE